MKTLKNIKRMIGLVLVMVSAMSLTPATAADPQKLYNDTFKEGRLATREICIEADDNYYIPAIRIEMTYSADGKLATKNIYYRNHTSQSWTLSQIYLYTNTYIELITHDENGQVTDKKEIKYNADASLTANR